MTPTYPLGVDDVDDEEVRLLEMVEIAGLLGQTVTIVGIGLEALVIELDDQLFYVAACGECNGEQSHLNFATAGPDSPGHGSGDHEST